MNPVLWDNLPPNPSASPQPLRYSKGGAGIFHEANCAHHELCSDTEPPFQDDPIAGSSGLSSTHLGLYLVIVHRSKVSVGFGLYVRGGDIH